ncbi:MAG: DUF4398 domain-containing protein [Gammaproteobacteria bacterium]|nr:DUF4398 domain-containing protein [Gammaproteobacteria bacterium]
MMKKTSRFQLPQLSRSGVACAVLAGGVMLMAGCAGTPPTEQIAITKAAVAHASNAGTTQFAPVELQSAKDKLARAEQAMEKEDYALASQLADEALADARLAEAKSESAQAQKAAKDSQDASRVLREEINRKAQ